MFQGITGVLVPGEASMTIGFDVLPNADFGESSPVHSRNHVIGIPLCIPRYKF